MRGGNQLQEPHEIAVAHSDEHTRLSSLRRYQILGTKPEPEYDNITALASIICETPFAALTFVDSRRQWFKSSLGFGNIESPRSVSFCAHTIQHSGPMVIADTLKDDRFRHNPYVIRGPRLRFYAGVPISMSDGHALGAVCVMDVVPRVMTAEHLDALSRLAHQATFLLRARLHD